LVGMGALIAHGQTILPLYPDQIPNLIKQTQRGDSLNNLYQDAAKPTLQVFFPPEEKANRTAIIICPGGAYQSISYNYEGLNIANDFNKIGVTAFILKYRLPNGQTMFDQSLSPLQDAQQAIKIVREGAQNWHIDDNKIGIIGFSAGGNVASVAATHFQENVIDNSKHTNLRPDFMILVYPVISMTDSLTHRGSRDNLLGLTPSMAKIKYYSSELNVTDKTPPTLLLHAGDDTAVSVLNSIRFYEALLKNAVPAEMHIYSSGNHGFLQNKSV
jgi:acetyl esterase/lipase